MGGVACQALWNSLREHVMDFTSTDGTATSGEVWSAGPMPGTVWVLAASGATVVQVKTQAEVSPEAVDAYLRKGKPWRWYAPKLPAGLWREALGFDPREQVRQDALFPEPGQASDLDRRLPEPDTLVDGPDAAGSSGLSEAPDLSSSRTPAVYATGEPETGRARLGPYSAFRVSGRRRVWSPPASWSGPSVPGAIAPAVEDPGWLVRSAKWLSNSHRAWSSSSTVTVSPGTAEPHRRTMRSFTGYLRAVGGGTRWPTGNVRLSGAGGGREDPGVWFGRAPPSFPPEGGGFPGCGAALDAGAMCVAGPAGCAQVFRNVLVPVADVVHVGCGADAQSGCPDLALPAVTFEDVPSDAVPRFRE